LQVSFNLTHKFEWLGECNKFYTNIGVHTHSKRSSTFFFKFKILDRLENLGHVLLNFGWSITI